MQDFATKLLIFFKKCKALGLKGLIFEIFFAIQMI